jgi:hypothetical protein
MIMDTPDVLIYVHPEFPAGKRANVEDAVMKCNGVIAANFDHHKQPHALTVVYNKEAVNEDQILKTVRQFDPSATMVGL